MQRKAPFLLAWLLAFGCVPAASPPPAPDRTIQLLLVNDVYIGEPMSNGLGGVARLKTLRDQLSANGPVKVMLAGDFLFPSLLSKWYKGSQIVEYFNASGLDYATYGNHEFDDSRQTLVERIAQSRFKWTSANCTNPDATPMPGVSAWDTLTISGVKIGVFGLTLRQSYPRWIRCADPDSAAHAVIPVLRAAGVDLIVGLTHQTAGADSALLVREPDIAFILGGHEHSAKDIRIGDRFVIKADKNAQSAQLVTLVKTGTTWSRSHRLIQLDASIPSDASTQALVDRWQDSLERMLGPETVIATSSQPLDASNVPIRSHETAFGNYAADAIRAGTGADVVATIGGAMRYDDVIPAGKITNRQIESIFLFPDETRIVTFSITGKNLREALERSVFRGGAVFGGYLQVSGVRFSWDPARPVGSRIVGDLSRDDGTAIKPGDSIRLAINAYTACDGGDGYSFPESAEACKTRDSGPRAAQLLMDYMRAQKTITLPSTGRVVRLPRDAPGNQPGIDPSFATSTRD